MDTLTESEKKLLASVIEKYCNDAERSTPNALENDPDIVTLINIAVVLGLPDNEELLGTDPSSEPDPGDMDGDAASALTSAGWGSDEDYGYYNEN